MDGENFQVIKTLTEVETVLKNKQDSKKHVFIGLDFSNSPYLEIIKTKDVNGHSFWSCSFPQGFANELRLKGAEVLDKDDSFPFESYRSNMYSQEELIKVDTQIFNKVSKKERNIRLERAKWLHDFTIREALLDFLKDKAVVSFFGGHAVKRASVDYKQIVLLAKRLAEEGFAIVSGGGPGVMEATNLGGYLAGRTIEEVEEAFQLIQQGSESYEKEFLNVSAAEVVTKRFGIPKIEGNRFINIGIPTFEYGDEPFNRFSTYICKFFSKAVRHEVLIDITNGGAVFAPGSVGTRQEIFTYACKNHEVSKPAPMIFLNKQFWNGNGLYPLISNVESDLLHLLLCTDDIDEIVIRLTSFKEDSSKEL